MRVYNRALSAAEIGTDMNRSVTPSDTSPPTAPGTLSGTGTLTTAQLTWGPATDNVGVAKYDVYRGTSAGFTPSTANRIAQPTGTSYTDTVAAGSYFYKVAAEDAVGNVGPTTNEVAVTVGDTVAPGAPGTLTVAGGVGKATLAWGAATDNVGVVRYDVYRGTSTGFTPSTANRIAQPTGTSFVDTVAPGTYFYKVAAEDAAGNIGPASNEASGVVTVDTTPPSAPTSLGRTVAGSTVNLTWTASTDDVGVVRYNVHRGTSAGFTADASNRIGQPTATSFSDAGLAIGTYYYKVTAEDAAGNLSPVSNEVSATVADATAPSAPGTVTASVAGSTVNLSWAAATDNVGVLRYNVHRGTVSTFTPSAANRVGQPTGTSFSDTSVPAGSWFYKVTAEDAAGNVGPVSNTASATVADTTAPTAPTGLAATGGAGQATLSWTASTDNVAVTRYNVHRATTSGFTPSTANRIAQPTGTSYTDNGLSAGNYYYKVTAEDAAGNISAASNESPATVTTPPAVGLVAAYGFDEGTGATTADQSGSGNTGTLANTAWAGAGNGKFGNALSFNGSTSLVTAANSASLNLTTGMTIEAWVKPTSLASWNTVVFKERTGYYGWAMYANTGTNRPSANNFTSGDNDVRGTAQVAVNTWTHLAATYDGTVLALYVNGTQAATLVASGAMNSGTGSLRIGGNTIWGEYFNGLIDEVRVYNRALSAAEITTDMNKSVTAPDTTPPTAPTNFVRTGGSYTTIATSWTASTDNVGVTQYRLYRAGNQVGTATGTTFTFTGLTCSTSHNLEVEAIDAAGNVSSRAQLTASTDACDTTPPTAPATLTATGAIGQASLSWPAATDNVGVVRYDLYRGTSSGFTPSAGNLIAQPTTTSYADTGLAAGTYYYKVAAEDLAGNIGPVSPEANAAVTADTSPPTAPTGLTATGGSQQAVLSWTAATDNVGVVRYNVHRATSPGFTPSTANRIAQPATAGYTDTGLPAATYYYKVTAQDATGNVGPASNEASAVVTNPPPAGLVAGYGFDEGTGTTATDSSGRGNTGTLANGAGWALGRFGTAATVDGVNDWVTVPDSASLDLTTAMTLEAWVMPTVSTGWRSVIFKEGSSDLVYGMYASTNANRPTGEASIGGSVRSAAGTAQLPANAWTHLAATYDGTTLRLYVNGVQVGTQSVSGTIAVSNGALRIGGNNLFPEWFAGRIDEVRVYNRALTAGEIQTDMGKSVANDSTPPTVVASTPAAGATEVPIGVQPTARFSEPVDPSTLGAFEIRDSSGTLVPSTVSYDELTATATLVPSVALTYGTTYTATIRSGASGLKDRSGNALATDKVWTFAAESVPPPILVIGSTSNKFTLYTTEILRAEGLNDYATLDISLVSPFVLSYYNVAILGDTPLTPTQVTTLTNWVNAGGNLIALHPDKQLAGLLGLTDNAATLTNAYLKVDTTSAAGSRHRRPVDPVPRHGRPLHAERRHRAGLALLERRHGDDKPGRDDCAPSARTAATLPRSPSTSHKSIVYTRQGNPAWAGQDRDGVGDIRTNDLFYGAKSGDVQPDWTDTSKIGDPAGGRAAAPARQPDHADEPRQDAAAAVLVPAARQEGGRDHDRGRPRDRRHGGALRHATWRTARPGAPSPTGSASARRRTSTPTARSPTRRRPRIPPRASRSRCTPASTGHASRGPTAASTRGTSPRSWPQFAAKYTSVPAPVTNRTHCVEWIDWATEPKVELAHGIRLDTNYYHYPASWIGNKPGLPRGHRRDHALRRPRRQPDRRLPGADAQHGRVEHGPAGLDQLPARQGARRGGVLRLLHRAHPYRHRREPGLRRSDRLGPVARRAGHLREAGADVDGRPQQLDLPELLLERRHARLHHQRSRRLERSPGDAPDDVERRPPERDHPQRHGGALHHADDQGHRVRLLRRRHRHVLGDVLVTAQALVTARRPAGRRRRARPGE